jgi:magnesium transporter
LVDGDGWTLVSACVPVPDSERTELRRVDCVVGERWVLTVHDGSVAALDEFRERAMGSGATGRLDGPSFLATLLEWGLGEYARAFEDVEAKLEELDVRALEGDLADPEQELRRLVGLRRDVGELRRHLAGHREPLVALTHPELDALSSEQSARRFRALVDRLDVTLQAARDAREAIVGSFDVLMARTEHRTNEILKILTLASVLFLPGSLIAAILGMNFKVPLFEHTGLFWVVVALVAGIIVVTTGLARLRRWV